MIHRDAYHIIRTWRVRVLYVQLLIFEQGSKKWLLKILTAVDLDHGQRTLHLEDNFMDAVMIWLQGI